MKTPIPPGVFDILPQTDDTWRSAHLWQYVEEVIRDIARLYGYQEIRTPIFERVELFQRSVGETSDIVSKEIYVFEDKGKRMMSLRPEGTAPVMRAFIENQLVNQGPVHKLFYIGPMFRYDRPQAGRYRQHHQFGAEVIGVSSPEQDAEMIDMVYTLYSRLGIQNLTVYINSIGNQETRKNFRDALQNYLRPHFDQLSKDSQHRFEANPLRILDSKDPNDQAIVAKAPSILDCLDQASKENFERIQACLNALKIPYTIDHRLVRGLDYYNNTVFEIVAGDLGAQNSIGGGGRYDGLLKMLEGPDLPSVGFATGIERIIQTMLKQQVKVPPAYRPQLFIITLGDAAKEFGFKFLHKLRQEGIDAQMDFTGRKLGKVMQYADQIRAKFVIVIGDDELKSQEVELKVMETGETSVISLSSLSHLLNIDAKTKTFMELWPQMSTPFQDAKEAEFFFKKLCQTLDKTTTVTSKLHDSLEAMNQFLKDQG